MDIQGNNDGSAISSIPANRRLVETLFASGIITPAARRDALELLYPARNWGLWTSRLLLALGVALVLSGIVYFFAFNWAKVPVAAKFGVVEAGLFGCVIAAYLTGLRSFPGKLLLLSASVLVGVFMAVFGQIYQTGADAYTLFMMWALVILPWVVISEFAPLWVVWLAVVNLFAYLYLEQTVDYSRRADLEYLCLILVNGAALALRELLSNVYREWLAPAWTRYVLVAPTLYFSVASASSYIFGRTVSLELTLAFLLALIVHLALFILYRFSRTDIWALTATLLSACTILELAMIHVMLPGPKVDSAAFLIVGLATVGIFTGAVILLRMLSASMEAKHA